MSEREDLDRARELGRLLVARGWMLATAESCTGGLIGHLLTELSGSSDFFTGGIISYSNEVKIHLLGVSEEDIRRHGAVSAQVARQMAQGARRVTGAQVAVSVTGIAGPTGATPDKPLGTTFIGLSSPLGELTEQHQWPLDRTGNKLCSARRALDLVIELLQER
ncbi:MAG: CinA family protein [Anaerolineae bacterium]|jgi:PncC family amidohydrolase